MRFHCSGQLRRQEEVFLCSRMVQVDQHPPPGVRLVEGVVDVGAARLAFFFLSCRLANMDDGVVLAGAQIYDICAGQREYTNTCI